MCVLYVYIIKVYNICIDFYIEIFTLNRLFHKNKERIIFILLFLCVHNIYFYLYCYVHLKGDSGGPLHVKGVHGQLEVIGMYLCLQKISDTFNKTYINFI